MSRCESGRAVSPPPARSSPFLRQEPVSLRAVFPSRAKRQMEEPGIGPADRCFLLQARKICRFDPWTRIRVSIVGFARLWRPRRNLWRDEKLPPAGAFFGSALAREGPIAPLPSQEMLDTGPG